jgi:hypothetical protein
MSTFKPHIVECILRREGGTHVAFDDCARWPAGAYHFRPGLLQDARHACVIPVREHFERLISLPEAYRVPHADDLITAPPAPAAPKAAAAASAPAAAQEGEQSPDGQKDGDDDDDDDDTTADAWDATKVLALGVNKITPLAKNYTDEQLRELIDKEGQRPDPRESLVRLLTATLRGRAAG